MFRRLPRQGFLQCCFKDRSGGLWIGSGELKIWSEPRAGTEAELTVPARIAYGRAHRRKLSKRQ
jgi:hypothetical protein